MKPGPAKMTYFLEDVVRYLLMKNQHGFQNTIIVFPNRRARLFFNAHLVNYTEKPVWAPDYFTISDFVQQLSGLQLADQLTLLFSLYNIFKDLSGSNEPFDSFYYYCEMMLSDFDDVDKYLLKPEILFKNISEIHTLSEDLGYLDEVQIQTISQFWDICVKSVDTPEKEQFVSLWDLFHRIYLRFRDHLAGDGLAYEGMAYRKAVENLESGDFLSGKQLVFIGFNALNRAEELIFDHFRKRGNTLFFWDYNDYYVKDNLHEAGLFLRNYLHRYPSPLDFLTTQSPTETQKIQTIAVPSNIAQAKLIPYCFDKLNNKYSEHAGKTAIVLADENLLMPVLLSLPPAVKEINVSMGYPIINTPAFSFISILNGLHRNKRKRRNGKDEYEFYHSDFFNVLKHNFLSKIESDDNIHLFINRCREKNLIYIDAKPIIDLHPLLNLIFDFRVVPDTFGSYLAAIIEFIALQMADDDQSPAVHSWEIEVLYAIHKVLMRFNFQLQNSGISMQFPTLLNLLRKILT